ncbi:class I SAM-dependent DNA methyltransferase [Kushneria aurantia]|uniref:Class I SAM-dependent DNA methyltransferase n=1 Tax=Kushneria aurantia TaxID=504092 RepID=A0ABV6G1M0_9GAMM|nr:class I SAM-dependent methyltransferase [Kushneria aurantia]
MTADDASIEGWLRQAHACAGDAGGLRTLYERWAPHYNRDMLRGGYRAPALVVELLIECGVTDRRADLLDAGCGTGLVGVALVERGFECLDGVDLCDAMVALAAGTDVYRHLAGGVDLNRGLAGFADASVDAVVSAGVFGPGQVAPEALNALLRLVRPGGVVVLTTSAEERERYAFQHYLARRVAAGDCALERRLESAPWLGAANADYWALRVG